MQTNNKITKWNNYCY